MARPLGRGDQHVMVQVVVPQNLTPKQKELFTELSHTLNVQVLPPREKGILGSLKDTLGEFFNHNGIDLPDGRLMSAFTEISVVTDGEAAEVVAEILRPFAYRDGVVLEQQGDEKSLDPNALEPEVTVKIYVPEAEDTPALRQRIEEILYHLNRLYPVPAPSFRVLQETDWANAWKEHYRPFRIGERIWIRPSWYTDEQIAADETAVAARRGGFRPDPRSGHGFRHRHTPDNPEVRARFGADECGRGCECWMWARDREFWLLRQRGWGPLRSALWIQMQWPCAQRQKTQY